ncbi:MAG TPA: DUF6544 family protein [Coleofasciculaceae cyanobacterium]
MIPKMLWVIGSLLAIALIRFAILQARNNAKVTQIWKTLQIKSPSVERFNLNMIANQPEPVQRYFRHAIAPNTLLANSVQLTLQGSMRLAPDQDWMPLQAEEILSTQGFIWKATAGQGMMQMQGADYYTNGDGRSRFSLWGLIPVVNAHSSDTIRSGIGRWAGEYFWLPSVLLPQRGVSWQAIDERTIQANLKADDVPITLTFVIDEQGRLLRGSLLRWGNQTEEGHYTEIPFGGENLAEQTFDGYTIPSQMGAGWWIGTDRYFEFIRMTVKQAQFH